MMFFTTLVLFVGISLISARPAELDTETQFQKDPLKNIQQVPVQTEVRSVAENARIVAEDMTKAVGETGVNLLKAGQEFLKPVDSFERSNLRSTLNRRVQNLGKAYQENTRDLIQKVVENVKTVGK